MESTAAENKTADASASDQPRLTVWGLLTLALAVAAAWLAFMLQEAGFAPALLFPLTLGALVGVGCAEIARWSHVRSRQLVLIGAALAALVAVVGQDVFSYVRETRPADDSRLSDPRVRIMLANRPPPPKLPRYLANRVVAEPLWWSLDVVLTIAATLGVVAFSVPRPSLPPTLPTKPAL